MLNTLQYALFGLMFGTGTSAAEVPLWEGYWTTNANWCVNTGEAGDETPTWIGRDGLYGIEWSCEITSVEPTGFPQSWTLKTTCLGAGLEYTDEYIMLVDMDDRLLQINQTGQFANLVRCPAPK